MAPDDDWTCPHGHGNLLRNDTNGVHHTCGTCRGFAVTIWLLDELLADGVGASIWRAAATGAGDGDPCPLCRRPMQPVPAPPPGTDEGRIEVCRSCEAVWIDAVAIPLLPVHPGVEAMGVSAPVATNCPTCGAPYDDYLASRCRYCHSVIANRGESGEAAPEVADAAAREHADARWPEDIVHEYIEGQDTHAV